MQIYFCIHKVSPKKISVLHIESQICFLRSLHVNAKNFSQIYWQIVYYITIAFAEKLLVTKTAVMYSATTF